MQNKADAARAVTPKRTALFCLLSLLLSFLGVFVFQSVNWDREGVRSGSLGSSDGWNKLQTPDSKSLSFESGGKGSQLQQLNTRKNRPAPSDKKRGDFTEDLSLQVLRYRGTVDGHDQIRQALAAQEIAADLAVIQGQKAAAPAGSKGKDLIKGWEVNAISTKTESRMLVFIED